MEVTRQRMVLRIEDWKSRIGYLRLETEETGQ